MILLTGICHHAVMHDIACWYDELFSLITELFILKLPSHDTVAI